MVAVLLNLFVANSKFLHSGEFPSCSTDGILTRGKPSSLFTADLYSGLFTPVATSGTDTFILNGHGYSPQYNRIVGSNLGNEKGLFFAGPSRRDPSVIGIDIKKLDLDVGSGAGDIITNNDPASADIWYGKHNDSWDMMVSLLDPEDLKVIGVYKSGYPTTDVWDLAFVDSGSYGESKKVWFSVIGTQGGLVLLRGIVQNQAGSLVVNVDNMGVLKLDEGVPPHKGDIIGAMYADAENNIYAGANRSGVIYRINVSDPANPDMMAHLQTRGPPAKMNDGSRCRFAKYVAPAMVPIPTKPPTATTEETSATTKETSVTTEETSATTNHVAEPTTTATAPVPVTATTEETTTTTKSVAESTTTATSETTTTTKCVTESTTTAATTTEERTTTTEETTTTTKSVAESTTTATSPVPVTDTTTTTPCLTTETETTAHVTETATTAHVTETATTAHVTETATATTAHVTEAATTTPSLMTETTTTTPCLTTETSTMTPHATNVVPSMNLKGLFNGNILKDILNKLDVLKEDGLVSAADSLLGDAIANYELLGDSTRKIIDNVISGYAIDNAVTGSKAIVGRLAEEITIGDLINGYEYLGDEARNAIDLAASRVIGNADLVAGRVIGNVATGSKNLAAHFENIEDETRKVVDSLAPATIFNNVVTGSMNIADRLIGGGIHTGSQSENRVVGLGAAVKSATDGVFPKGLTGHARGVIRKGITGAIGLPYQMNIPDQQVVRYVPSTIVAMSPPSQHLRNASSPYRMNAPVLSQVINDVLGHFVPRPSNPVRPF